jgi:hypothetical protein
LERPINYALGQCDQALWILIQRQGLEQGISLKRMTIPNVA